MTNKHQPLDPEPQTPNDEQNKPDPSAPQAHPPLAETNAQDDIGQDPKDDQDEKDKRDARDVMDVRCKEYLDGWRRAKADYDNLRKDYEKSRLEIAEYANENLLYELLPAIEHYETALEHVPDISNLPDEDKKKLQNWITGIKAVKQLWEQAFKSIGLEHIEIKNGFDPTLHEAMSTETEPDLPEGQILKVIQPGWKLKNKVLRPAKVVVNNIKI